eukprot:7260937-Ditylum_brightwellii.AAC.1
MDAVDRGDQASLKGGGFYSKAYYKKLYKRDYFGITDFGLFNANTFWNLSGKDLVVNSRKTHIPLLKWEFTAITSEDLVIFDQDEDDKHLP